MACCGGLWDIRHFKWYQVRELFLDPKLYIFFLLGVVGNVPNGGISNFGTIIIKGTKSIAP